LWPNKKGQKKSAQGEALRVALPRAKTALPLSTPTRRALSMAPEHLNLNPVQQKNVPIFSLKGEIFKNLQDINL